MSTNFVPKKILYNLNRLKSFISFPMHTNLIMNLYNRFCVLVDYKGIMLFLNQKVGESKQQQQECRGGERDEQLEIEIG